MDQLAARYRPLDTAAKEIRVLEVAAGTGADVVKCSLRYISLLAAAVQPYETISYYWGASDQRSRIILDGRDFDTTANSAAALRCMRLAHTSRSLWIDAVCINQDSTSERSQQVAMMATIYAQGTRNLIYLGEAIGETAPAINAVRKVVQDMRADTADFTRLAEILLDQETGMALLSKKDFAISIDFAALTTFYSLPWFRRLWVCQEIVLARSNLCHWGQHQLDIVDVLRAARWLAYKRMFIPAEVRTADAVKTLDGPTWMFGLLEPHSGMAESGDLLNRNLSRLMMFSQRFEKTEPRDSVYALIGLFERAGGSPVRTSLLDVDYGKSLSHVLRDATRFALLQDGNLYLLGRILHSVVDFNQSLEGNVASWAFRADSKKAAAPVRLPDRFNSCGKLEVRKASFKNLTRGPDCLILEGFTVAVIAETTIAYDEGELDNTGYHNWLLAVQRVNQQVRVERSAWEIASTLTLGEAFDGTLAPPEELQSLENYLIDLNSYTVDCKEQTGYNREKLQTLRKSLRTRYCFGRRYFATNGGYIGLGPRCMQPDDIVVILSGGSWPFVLRPGPSCYYLVGAAYVLGIMYGDAVDAYERSGESLETFVLA